MSQVKRNVTARNIGLKIWLLIVLFTLLVGSSYTWLSISRTPRVSEMQISIDSPAGLELARDWRSETWTQHLDVSDFVGDIEPLKPVTWVNSEEKFYTAEYSVDGRIINFNKELSDDENANQYDSNGYYMKLTFFARTGANVTVSLSEAVTSEDGIDGAGTYVIGTPLWNGESVLHNNGGNGAEYTVRVGIKITKLNQNGNEKANSMQFYVYEPNYDGHVDGLVGGVATPSIDGDESLVPENQLIRQTTSTWTEAYPVQRNVVIQELGEFVSDTKLFELAADEYAKIDLYFWMEGQDVDCSYAIGQDAEIMANIQFKADAQGQSGLEEFR